MIGDRSVWSLVLWDLADVKNLPHVKYKIPSMTADELRMKAIHITRIDELWSQDGIKPIRIEDHFVDSDAVKVEVTPGGRGILIQLENGDLELHDSKFRGQSCEHFSA